MVLLQQRVAVTAQHCCIMPSSAQRCPQGLCSPACSSIVQCSGTLIGRQHVLTAGHCVVDTDTGSVIANMQVSSTSSTCIAHHSGCTCAEVHAGLKPQAQDPRHGCTPSHWASQMCVQSSCPDSGDPERLAWTGLGPGWAADEFSCAHPSAKLELGPSAAEAPALKLYLMSLQFWLAYNGDDEPFQPMTVSKTYVLDQFANQNSVSTSSLNYDFAIVLLSSPMGSGAAQLAIAAGSGERTFNMRTAGYPGEAGQAC